MGGIQRSRRCLLAQLPVGLLLLALLSAALATALPGQSSSENRLPLVINVWPFIHANDKAWDILQAGGTAVDAVVAGCSVCEREQCDGSVGFGGSPGENGETTLDAMVIDGDTMDVGAVGGLRRVKNAVEAAKMVLRHTQHSLLVGDQATEFALGMGLPGPEDLSTPVTRAMWAAWQGQQCQPNYRMAVTPDSSQSCGPYTPLPAAPILASPVAEGQRDSYGRGSRQGRGRTLHETMSKQLRAGFKGTGSMPDSAMRHTVSERMPVRLGSGDGRRDLMAGDGSPKLRSHDTISMVAITEGGSMAAGTSTNGLTYHVPGRVGDAPIAGAGAYVDSEVGGCGATGDGDIMMRFLPCFHAVSLMQQGATPTEASRAAIARIRTKYPSFTGALFAVNRTGGHGGAVNNWVLQYTIRHPGLNAAQVIQVQPVP